MFSCEGATLAILVTLIFSQGYDSCLNLVMTLKLKLVVTYSLFVMLHLQGSVNFCCVCLCMCVKSKTFLTH